MNVWQSSLSKRPSLFPVLVGVLCLLFLLLINFMICNSVVFWSGVKFETSLALPRAENVDVNVADKLIVTITRSGDYFFNDRQMGKEDFKRELGDRVHQSQLGSQQLYDDEGSASHRPMVILRADKDTRYESIIELADICRALDLNVYLALEQAGRWSEARNFLEREESR
jgi:biopolymer transport protein ExbD